MKPALKVVTLSPYKIEKGIPIPRQIRGDILYPFADMNRDDSFLVPAAKPEMKKECDRLQRQVRLFRKRFGGSYEFTTRQVDGGVRCWRTK